MPDRSSKRKRELVGSDPNVTAARIVASATEDGQDEPADEEPTQEERSAAARLLGRRGGLKGGPARAKKLTPSQRKTIARKAAAARWKNRKKNSPE